MKPAFALLLALVLARPLAVAQEPNDPTRELAATGVAPELPPSAVLDGRLYWARFDAEQAARRARLDSVDVRTPRVLTLSLLAPGAGLLIIAAVKAMIEWSSDAAGEQERLVNRCLAGAGGVLAAGAIGAGVWWGRRRAERNTLKRQLDSASNVPRMRGPLIALQVRTASVGLALHGRF